MHKKLLAWAVASAFAAPLAAYAQGSNVVIYGTFNVDFENVESDSATNGGAGNSLVAAPAANGLDQGPRNRVSSNSSNIGFRGTEDLGNGLKAIFQLESGLNIDSGGGNLGGRNSNVGLTSPWGTVFYGIWDTPYKFVTLRQDAWYATGIAAGTSIYASPGFNVSTTTQSGRVGVAPVQAIDPSSGLPIPGVFTTAGVSGAPDANFDRRQGNSVQYWTPVFAGLSGRLAYSANEQKSANEANPNINPYIGSAAIIYENGPIYANLTYERHEDYFGLFGLTGAAAQSPSATNQSSKDQGYKAGVGYTFFGTTTLNVVAERLEYENSQTAAGATTEYNRDAFYVSVLHKIGPGTIRASYGKAFSGDCKANGATCSTADLAAKAATIGYSHSFSKRTDVYALYVYIDNDRLASYNFGVNQLSAGVGSDPSGLALGIRHAF